MRTTTIIATTLAFYGSAAWAESPAERTSELTSMLAVAATATGAVGGLTPHWMKTIAPEKLEAYQSDMASLESSIRENPIYPTMTEIMETAIPESYKELLREAPSAAHKQFEGTHKPSWYEAIPTEVRSFMDANSEARQSVFKKDIGDLEKAKSSGEAMTMTGMTTGTTTTGTAMAAETGHSSMGMEGGSSNSSSMSMGGEHKDGKENGKTSEAPDSVRVAGAAAGTLFGAIAVAALLM